MITYDRINDYIESLVPQRSSVLHRLEQEAAAEHIPIIQLPSIQFLYTLVVAYKPKRILELGTAIGYSTIWLANAAPEAQIMTLEINEERIQRALANFAEAGIAERIDLVQQDAAVGLPAHEQFDWIFLDAAKGQYKKYVDIYLPHLKQDGIIVCDNILFRGLVAEEKVDNKRLAPLVKKISAFNAFMMNHPELDTSIIPIGDGISFSVKRRKVNEKP